VVGVLGAIAQDDMKRILAFHIISQIGYMILGLGLLTVAGVAAAVFYVIHHIIVKTALFLVAGLVDRRAGTSRLSEMGGLVRTAPLIAALFAVPALSLAGLPPFSGFLAKFALVDAGLEVDRWAIVTASLAVGLFTLYSMTKIWAGVFWGERDTAPSREPMADGRLGSPLWMVVATATLVAGSIAFSVWAGPLHELSLRAAGGLLDPSVYVEAVLGVDP
ncbi:MAG: proton-conducting transporter membrane subunit, partial [Ilumatobacter sp.]